MVTSVGAISSAMAATARTCQVTLQQHVLTHASLAGVKSDVSGSSSGGGTRHSILFRHVSSGKEDLRRGKCGTHMREAAWSGRLSERNRAGAGVRSDNGLRFCAVYAISSWIGQTHLGASSLSSFGSSWAQLVKLTKVVEDAARRVARRRTGRRGDRGQGGGFALSVQASVFGVGAPEALVIGVVALLVFGPKGLAEVARNLGKTLRSFQPTIQELRQVSNEFKNALEQEIGWDDVQDPNVPPAAGRVRPVPYESESTTAGGIGADTRPAAAGPTYTASQSSGMGGGGGVGAAAGLGGGDQGAITVTEEMKAASAREAWRISAPPTGGQQDGPAT
ncbi:hypothetical protein CBR_g49097 [Chara braunii]|uniref:Uncharacterized protein n=1 Tax=Chara braunii TaxID=69332 RepID=A0A388K4N9_CHABU|nr:hypothetical protein CBR_g49097 [Chara braunii]|eukprot:GBG65028.1 hypothetical protein CBR_g49097 [Chara braunii]